MDIRPRVIFFWRINDANGPSFYKSDRLLAEQKKPFVGGGVRLFGHWGYDARRSPVRSAVIKNPGVLSQTSRENCPTRRMDTKLIHETALQTLAGTITFPEVVGNLLRAGAEYYHVDYVALRKTYYAADGSVVAVTSLNYEDMPPVAADFDAAALRADILDSQTKGQPFSEFSRRAMAAGVQGYFAFLRGKRVTYLGRQGDQHVEWFPGAGPFTIEQIRAAYAKTCTGADFPRLIRDLRSLGVQTYDHLLATGANLFRDANGHLVPAENMGPAVPVAERADEALLRTHIAAHQRGESNYPTLCAQAGSAGVAKWTSDLHAMTCTYFDRAGRILLVEPIPEGDYAH